MGKLGPFTLGPNYTEEQGIYTGDATALGMAIPDNLVDLIFCDPVWQETAQYWWLAQFASRVLKPGGSVVAQVGHLFRWEAELAFRHKSNGLEPRITLHERLVGGHTALWKARAMVYLKTYLWFAKPGDPVAPSLVPEMVTGGGRRKKSHRWQDSTQAAETWIARLTKPHTIVVDPFCGSGMVPIACMRSVRSYLGFEIDAKTAEIARENCRQGQLGMIPASIQLEIKIPKQPIVDTWDEVHG